MKFAHNPFLRCCLTAAMTFSMVITAYADTNLTTGHTIIDTTGNPALGVITRAAGATALFDDNGIATATGTPLVDGILGPWAFIGTGTATRYATLDGSNNVVSFTGTATTWAGTINSATTNYEISANGTATYGGSERIANTIRYTGGAGSVISLGNTSAAGLTVNGLINAGTAGITFQHGGGAFAGAGIHIGATQELVLHAANADINVNARVHNHANGASAVTVLGPNTVTLSQANTYTGATTINGGKLVIPNITGATYSQVNLNSGTFESDAVIGSLTVANGVNNTVIPGKAGNALAATTVNFQGAASLNVQANGAVIDRYIQTSDLNSSAAGTVVVNATNTTGVWTSGTDYPAISYFGTFTGSLAHFTLGTVPGLNPLQAAELVDTGSSIAVRITGEPLVWTGNANTNWNTTSLNWSHQSNPVLFSTNSPVLFDDSASQFGVILTENVSPNSIVFENNNEDYTLSGGFGIQTGVIIKSGIGQVTINTNNSYSGSTTINDGTLRLGDGTTDGDISASSAIINNGTLVFNRSAGSFTYGNVISGFGSIAKNGAGTQILSGDNTFSSTTTINAGVLQIGNGGTTGSLGTSSVTNDASLVFNRSNAFTVGGAISGTGSVSQIGTGAVTLSSFNTYSGGTLVSQGTVRIGNNSALGTGAVNIASGAIVNNSVVLSGLANTFTGSGTFAGIGGQVTLSGDWTGFSGTVSSSPSGDLVFNGGFTAGVANTTSANAAYVNNFAAANTNGMIVQNQTGGTVTYQLGSYASAVGSNLRNSGTATGNVIFEIGNLNTSTEAAGTIGGGAQTTSLTKVGTGTLTLTGTNNYAGDTTVAAGILAVDGDAIPNAGKLVINGGQVAVAAAATETVNTLFLGGTQQAIGTYGPVGSGAANQNDTYFVTGSGIVSVTTGPPGGYSSWAGLYAPGQAKDLDHDNDGVKNGIEYFMGETGSTFTANPAAVGGTVTWPMGATYTGVYGTDYEIQFSTDLAIWTKVEIGTGDNTVSVTAGTSVVYDVPTGGKSFVRLVVKN
jgi:autotransporter-associated beta strand protein